MASNCTLGIQNLVKTTLNNKPWFEYDQSLGIVNILDSFAKKINKENSHGVAKTTAIAINKQINDGYKNIGDIAFVKSNKEGRGYIDIAPTINQIYLINAQNAKEINELQKQLDEEELLKGFYQTNDNQSLQEGLNWLKKVNSNVQPEIVQGLIDGIANGSYNSNLDLITLSEEFANKATIKHEFLHKILASLPFEQREAILNEASKKYGIARGESKTTTKYSQVQQNEINYALKALDILQSNKGDEIFRKGDKNNWNIDKILQELQIPKDQQDLIKSFNTRNREEIITNLLANYSFVVEINTAKVKKEKTNLGSEILPFGKKENDNTSYYSNLTVPGGTNYTENEIATPAITPSIKGHAQFASGNGIGWFRTDEKRQDELTNNGNWVKSISEVPNEFYYNNGKIRVWKDSDGNWNEGNSYIEDNQNVVHKYNQSLGNKISNTEATKTRRILEVQSDLFQKGRLKEDLILSQNEDNVYNAKKEDSTREEFWIAKEKGKQVSLYNNTFYEYNGYYYDFLSFSDKYYKIEKNSKIDTSENQFLQLLNKDNNWVTFFVKSIIQDSAKKGYEKVLFPSGNTASKVEGHTTLEEFKRHKEDRIKELEEKLKNPEYIVAWVDTSGYGTPIKFNSEKEALEFVKTENAKLIDDENNEGGYTYLFDKEATNREINQLKQELERVETEGFGALKPIYNFYENTVTNILNKTYGKENVNQITDEYGNTWNEIDLSSEKVKQQTDKILFQSPKLQYTGDLAIEEKIAEEAENSKDETVAKTPLQKFIQSIKNLFRNIFKERDKISRLLRDMNQGRLNSNNKNNTNQGIKYSLNNNSNNFVNFLTGKLDGSKLSNEIEGKLEANKDQLIALLGSSMYSEKLKDVVYKELLQNAFDATKIAESKGLIDKGKINIIVDERERTISFSDNGIGMTSDIVQKAFFTIGGTYKGDNVDNKLKSGGLGLAKMAFLFGSERLILETNHNGIKTKVNATSQEIRTDNFKIYTESTTDTNGTIVQVKIPEYYTNGKGEQREIDFPKYIDSELEYSFLKNPLIGNIDVNYSIVNRQNSYNKNESEKLTLGKLPETYKKLSKATTSFADIDIYVDTTKLDKSYRPKHHILSSGLFQFDIKFKTFDDETIPLNLIIDIKPKVTTTNDQYPFNNQREGFRPTVLIDINALSHYLKIFYKQIELELLKNSFKKIQNINKVDVETPDIDIVNLNKEILKEFSSSKNEEIINKVYEDFINDDVQISNGGLANKKYRKSKDDIDKEEKLNYEKKYSSSFKAEKNLEIDKNIQLNADYNKPIVHNNTTMVFNEEAGKFLSEISSIMLDYKNSIIDFYGEDYTDNLKTQLWGVSIDKTYGGVNVNPSFVNMLAINPFYQFPDNPKQDAVTYIAVALDHLLIHELNHNFERNEGAGFTGRFLQTYSEIHSLPNHFELISKFKISIKNNLETIKKLKYEYEQSENVESGFEGNKLETDNKKRTDIGIESISQNDSFNNDRTKKNDSRSNNEFGEILESKTNIKYQLSKEQSDAIDNVFDENPELADAVYESLGFANTKTQIAQVKTSNKIITQYSDGTFDVIVDEEAYNKAKKEYNDNFEKRKNAIPQLIEDFKSGKRKDWGDDFLTEIIRNTFNGQFKYDKELNSFVTEEIEGDEENVEEGFKPAKFDKVTGKVGERLGFNKVAETEIFKQLTEANNKILKDDLGILDLWKSQEGIDRTKAEIQANYDLYEFDKYKQLNKEFVVPKNKGYVIRTVNGGLLNDLYGSSGIQTAIAYQENGTMPLKDSKGNYKFDAYMFIDKIDATGVYIRYTEVKSDLRGKGISKLLLNRVRELYPNLPIHRTMIHNPIIVKQSLKIEGVTDKKGNKLTGLKTDNDIKKWLESNDELIIPPLNNQITPQQTQQAKEVYQQYINSLLTGETISNQAGDLSKSQVKDVLLHGSPESNLEKFNATWKRGFYATAYEQMAKGAGGSTNWDKVSKIYRVILNIKNPRIELMPAAIGDMERNPISYIKEKGYDSFIINNQSFKNNRPNEEVIVFEPSQIHILGGKSDIEQAKEFINNNTQKTEDYFSNEINKIQKESKVIENFLKEYETSKKIDNKNTTKAIKNKEEKAKKINDKLLSLGFESINENEYQFSTSSYITFKSKLNSLEGIDVSINTFKSQDYLIKIKIAPLKNNFDLQKQGELPFNPIELKLVLKENDFIQDIADNTFEGLTEEQINILRDNLENGELNLNCKI